MKSIKKQNKAIFGKALHKIITIVFFLAILTSCNNDDDAQPEQNIRLKTYSEGGVNEYNITYNDDGTLKSYQSPSEGGSLTRSIIYDVEGRIKQIGNTSYTYNNQNRVSKMTKSSGNETTIIYNNEGLIASFSSRHNDNFSSSTFEYDSKNRLKRINEENDGRYTRSSLTYDANDNIEQELVETSIDGISYFELKSVSYTYDSKLNPYFNLLQRSGNHSNMNIFHIISNIRFGGQVSYEGVYFYSKNNLLSSSFQHSFTPNKITKSYDYVYNENNYPTSVEIEYTYSHRPQDNRTIYKTWTYENF